MRPKRRPPRPKHPKFTYFHRSGLRFGRFPAQRRSIGGVGRHRRAWPRCRWAVAGPGRVYARLRHSRATGPSRHHTAPKAPPVWRAPEGPEGSAAVPVGGGGTRPGFETTRRAAEQCPGPTGVEDAGGTGGHGHGAGGWRQGQGGPRDRPLRAAGSRVAILRAGRRPPAHTAAGPHKAARPRSRIRRRPEHPWRPTTATTRRPRRAARAGTGRGSG